MFIALLIGVGVALSPAIPAVAASVATAEWPGYQGGPGHVGTVPSGGPSAPLRLAGAWARVRGQGRVASPVVVGDIAVTESRTRFVGLDSATGMVVWSTPRDRGNVLSPAVDPATGSVVATEGTVRRGAALVALEPSSGRVLLRVRLPQPATSGVTIAGNAALFGARGRRVYALDLTMRAVRWAVAMGGVVEAAPAVSGGLAFVASSSTTATRSRLAAIDLESGRVSWSYPSSGFTSLASGPSIVGRRVYAGFGDGTLRAFDALTGRVAWSSPLRDAMSPLSAPAVDRGVVYANDRLGGLYAFDATTGTRRWDFQFASDSLWGAPLVGRGSVFLGLDDGTVAAVSTGTGRLAWSTRLRFGPIGGLASSGGLLLAPLLGGGGGLASFRHDPNGNVLSLGSPTTLHLPPALASFAAAVAIMLAVVLLFFRVLLDPARVPGPSPARVAADRDEAGEPS